MNGLNKLLSIIERLRNELNELAEQLGVQAPEVIRKSAELDRMLNEYERRRLTVKQEKTMESKEMMVK